MNIQEHILVILKRGGPYCELLNGNVYLSGAAELRQIVICLLIESDPTTI